MGGGKISRGKRDLFCIPQDLPTLLQTSPGTNGMPKNLLRPESKARSIKMTSRKCTFSSHYLNICIAWGVPGIPCVLMTCMRYKLQSYWLVPHLGWLRPCRIIARMRSISFYFLWSYPNDFRPQTRQSIQISLWLLLDKGICDRVSGLRKRWQVSKLWYPNLLHFRK